MTSEESDYDDDLPPEINKKAKEINLDLLPDHSKRLYVVTYNQFKEWRKKKQTSSLAEELFLVYFKELSETKVPSTLWAKFSMRKATVKNFHNIDLSLYYQLIAFLKKANAKYKKKKAKVLSCDEVNKFINEAPDEIYLCYKVILIVGISGACRRSEITDITMEYVKVNPAMSMILIRIPKTKNSVERSFTITGDFYNICKKYIDLRPINVDRFIIHYDKGKCSRQPMGINTIGSVPKKIPEWLNLPDPALYTGHTFRRTSATLLADGGGNETEIMRHGGWKSASAARGYVDESIHGKKEINKKIMNCININQSDAIENNLPQLRQNEQCTNKRRIDEYAPSTSTFQINDQAQNDANIIDDQNKIDYDTFYRPSSTQEATYEPIQKKRKRNCDIDLQTKNVTLNINNCNVTININNYCRHNAEDK